jgi:protein phosphatase
VDDLRLAPFHLLATEGKVHTDQTHAWHMTTLARLAEHEPVLMATPWRTVRLDDEASVAEAVAWWTAHTEAGGEGMVVKPETYLTWNKGRLVQPAIKCRGREYLRIIYGAEYTLPHQLDRLRQRGTHRKRTLAMRELVLGLEALERFVAREPLRRIHTPVMGILALESEPVDPRL